MSDSDPIQEALEALIEQTGVKITPRSDEKAWAKSATKPRGFVLYRGTLLVPAGEGEAPVSTYIAVIVTPMWRYQKPHVDRFVEAIESTNQFSIRHPVGIDNAIPPIDNADDLADTITISVITNEAVGY